MSPKAASRFSGLGIFATITVVQPMGAGPDSGFRRTLDIIIPMTRIGLKYGLLFAIVVSLSVLVGCSGEMETPADGTEPVRAAPQLGVPHPILDDMEPVVASELEARRAAVDLLLDSREATEVEKGAALGRMGQLYQAHRLLEVAEDCYKQAQARDLESFAWPYYRGVLAARRGDADVAASALGRAVELAPEDVPAKIRLADLELDQGHVDAAERLYAETQKLDSDLAATRYGLGRVAAERRDFETAIKHYSQAAAQQPSASVIQYHLGQAYRQLGQIEQARMHLSRSGQVRVAMPDPLMQELTTLMIGASPHLTRGNAAMREGRFSAGAAQYRRAVEVDPENLRARQSLASVLLRLGDLEGAAEQFAAAVELSPDSARARSDLGVVLAEMGEDRRAMEHLRRAVELEPGLIKAQFNLANGLARAGRYDEAAAGYRQLLEVDPSHLEARSRLGTALAQAGRLDQGTEELRRVVERDPGDARARLNLGVALAEGGDLQGAIDQHLAVLDLRPDPARTALAHFNLGTFYKKIEDRAQAMHHYEKALAIDPDLAAAHFDLGEILYAEGRLVEALPHYSRAARVRPSYGVARLREASVLMRLERFDSARTVLEEGVRQVPRDLRLQHALARFLSASPESGLRDAQRAVPMATRVFETERSPAHAETLAMALAASGRFEEAVQLQRKVLEEAERQGQRAAQARLIRNLDLYEEGRECCARTSDVFPQN
jgi:tetratricopeptide (TPR) repeat protein